jgi:ankyrin repeat protein
LRACNNRSDFETTKSPIRQPEVCFAFEVRVKPESKTMAKRITETDAALLDAALKGDKEKVIAALKAQADIDSENYEGWTPIICAAISGETETVIVLLEAGAEVNAQAHDGSTALMKACLWGNGQIAAALLTYGADASMQDDEGWTALKFAVEKDHEEIVQMLEAAARLSKIRLETR